MKPGITRWNVSPLYNGRLTRCWVFGSTHDLRPVASPRKFFTVTGACSSYSFSVMSPTEVEMCVYNPSGRGVFGTAGAAFSAGAFLAAAFAGLGAAGV